MMLSLKHVQCMHAVHTISHSKHPATYSYIATFAVVQQSHFQLDDYQPLAVYCKAYKSTASGRGYHCSAITVLIK